MAALVPAIHVLVMKKDVDTWHEAGHDVERHHTTRNP
jgi:hypothetical protein